ncbi:YciI family protein [Neptuniibacter sp. PT8_73]|uniref:YciI family protein n=1 Tax=unclassified Neptuniibacter TaxID=2630693 RepID=UPI0039F66578
MFMVLLKFSDNKAQASEYMQDHNLWIKQGFDDGVFLIAGSLQPGLGGTVMVNGESIEELEARVQKDPFVEHNVVSAEILEIEPKKVDARLNFLNEPRN